MLRLATDEDFNNRIVRGLLRRQPDLDLLRIQDAGLAGRDDEAVLAWAARRTNSNHPRCHYNEADCIR